MALDEDIKTFMIHISSLSLGSRMTIYLAKKTQIALLLAKKVIILAKYLDFANAFLEESANVLSEQTKTNEHATKLEQSK